MYRKLCQKVFVGFIVIALLNVTMGCDRTRQPDTSVSPDAVALVEYDQVLFSTELSTGRLDIQAISIDSLDKIFTFILRHSTGGTFEDRLLSIRSYETDSNAVGIRHILTDRAGGLLWAFDYAVDTTDKNHWWFTERTLFDEMTVARWSGPGFIEETYTINGDSRTFHFNTSDVEKLRSLHEAVLSGDSLTALSIEDAEIVVTLRAFEDFYVSDNTLHNSDDGTLLFEVLTNDALAGWLSVELIGDGDQPMSELDLCDLALICVLIKCHHPNVVCPWCLAFVATCEIMDFFNLW